MLSDQEIRNAAGKKLADHQLRMLIDAELNDEEIELPDVHMKLAADMLCDAAMEVAADRLDAQKIKKTFVLGDVIISFSEMEIVNALDRNVANGCVSTDELNALLARSSVASVVAQALEAGTSEEDIAAGEIQISSIRLTALKNPPRKGLLSKIFGQG